jgi:hypothetical protein
MAEVMRRTGQQARVEVADWKDTLGRVGLVGRGVLYAIIGLLALQLAFGSPDQEASPQGALQWVAEQPFGKFLLVAMTVMLFALAAWRFLDAALGDPVEGDEASDRLRFLAKAAFYLTVAVAALAATISSWGGDAEQAGGGSGSGESQKQAAGVVLDWPMGQWIVGIAGLCVIGYAVYMFKRHAVDATFMERLSTSSDAVERFGRLGYAARSVVWAVIGVLFVQAAVTYNPDEAGGLSTALQELAGTSWGPWLLTAVAAGLFAFGAFCLAEAKYRRAA